MAERASVFWSDVRSAIAGAPHDYTGGSLARAVLLLAIPMVLEMCMESLFAVVDVFWVASLGADATAAVGLTESVQTLLYAVALGIGMATTATVARRIGEKNAEGASLAAGQALLIGFSSALLIGVPGAILAPKILALMGAERSVIEGGSGFTRIIQGSTPAILLLFLNNAIFRGAGDAAIAMRVLWIANIINLILDPCFIFGWGPFPRLGVTGAAVSTTIGRSVGVIIQLAILLGSYGRIKIRIEHLRPDWAVLRRLTRISSTGMLQNLIATASWVGIVRIIALFGKTAIAGNTIAVRIVVFTILPSWGLSNAAATLVGQNLGARKPERAESAAWRTGFYNVVFLGVVGLVFLIVPEPLVRFFTLDEAVVQAGALALRTFSYGYPFYGLGMVLVQAFNGAGDTLTPTIINVVCLWLVEIPLAWTLAEPAGFGLRGAYWAVPLGDILFTLVGVWLFRKGYWKKQKV
jgi:putative MATE family efflux protein